MKYIKIKQDIDIYKKLNDKVVRKYQLIQDELFTLNEFSKLLKSKKWIIKEHDLLMYTEVIEISKYKTLNMFGLRKTLEKPTNKTDMNIQILNEIKAL